MSDNLYFEPPSRLQLVDKLAHLLRFSNTLLVLAGPSGAGVTTVTEQLHSQAVEDDVYILSLRLSAATNVNNLLKLLNDAMDELVNPQDSVDQDGLTLLHKKIDTLSKLQRKLLISIDNADFLSDEASESLVNLLSANQGKIAITLAGSESLVARAKTLVEAQGLSESLHVEILSPFNRLETEEFIQLRFLRGNDFSNKQLSEIYLNSEGYPGRITLMTSQMIKSGKISLNGKNNILPVPHIIGIAVLLTAIAGGLLWQSSSDEALQDASVNDNAEPLAGITSQSLVLDINEEEQLADGVQAKELESEIAALSERIKAQEQLIDKAKEDSALSQENTVETAGIAAVDENDQSALSQADQIRNTDIELIDQIETANGDEASQLITDQVQETGSIAGQLVSDNLPSAENIEQAEEAINPGVVKIEPTTNANDTVASDDQADTVSIEQKQPEQKLTLTQQFAQLSGELKKNIDPAMLQPAVNQGSSSTPAVIVEDLNANIKPVKAPEVAIIEQVDVKPIKQVEAAKVIKKTPKKVVATVKPKKVVKTTATEKVTDASVQKWLSHDVILNWPSSGYTLQLLGARSQSSAVRFLQSMPNSEKMYYYKTELKNRDWNVIIYGQYANRTAATSAIAKLPKALRELKPWPKAIITVKNSIKK